MSQDSTKPRLQLSLGSAALLAEERPSLGGRRLFAGTCRESGVALVVTLQPFPPEGPEPVAMRGRISRLQALAHPRLNTPLRSGDMDGRAWVVEADPGLPTALARLEEVGVLTVRDGLRTLREITRAVASLHRAGLAHGSLDLTNVHFSGGDVKVAGLGTEVDGDPADDLAALGVIAWALFTGDLPDHTSCNLSERRRGIPAELNRLVASMLAPDPALRPGRAETILAALDSFPTTPSAQISDFLEGAGRGARPPRSREAVLMVLLLALSVLVSTLVLGR